MAATATCNSGDLHAANGLKRSAMLTHDRQATRFPVPEFHTIEVIRGFLQGSGYGSGEAAFLQPGRGEKS